MTDDRYYIKVVYDHEGNLKPERMGRITSKPILTLYGYAIANYICLADGTPYENKMLCTSQVIEWHEDEDCVSFSTLNSKYVFERVNFTG